MSAMVAQWWLRLRVYGLLAIGTATVGLTTPARAPVTIGRCGSAQRELGTLPVYGTVALLGKQDVDPAADFFLNREDAYIVKGLPAGQVT